MDFVLATYLGVSILLCFIAYKAKSIIRVNWNDSRLYERQQNSNTIVVIDPAAPQAALAGLTVASRPSSKAGDIGLVLLVVWMIGFAAGGIFFPISFGRLGEVTTINVVMLFAAAVIWGFIFARTFLSAVRVFFVVLIPIALLIGAVFFILTFAMGGPEKLTNISLGGMNLGDSVGSAASVATEELSAFNAKNPDRQIVKNACSLFTSISAIGDMERVRYKCDKDWREATLLKQEQDAKAQQRADQETRGRNALLYSAHLKRVESLAEGISNRPPKGSPARMPGAWAGSSSTCNKRHINYQLRLRESTGNVLEGVMILRWGFREETPAYSAFRVRVTMEGRNFTMSPVTVIQKGPEEMFEAKGSIANSDWPAIFLEIPSQSCRVRFNALAS